MFQGGGQVTERWNCLGESFCMTVIDMILVTFSCVGFFISSYFTAVAYRWIRPDDSWIPFFCRMGERTCASIIDTPRARLLGVPNSALGQLFYLALVIGVVTGELFAYPFYTFYLVASALTVLVGLFLTYSLLFWTRVSCPLCFASHGINFVIFLLLVL